jgi:hypothetical protein
VRLAVPFAAWLLVGGAVGLGVYDLYVSRGAREYLQRAAEAELGRGPTVQMVDVMNENKHAGARAAGVWMLVVAGAGWATVLAGRRGLFGPGR